MFGMTARLDGTLTPFTGSGTTLAAAELTERVRCGIERFKAALDEAAHRLMGASFDSMRHYSAAQDRIVEDVTSGFCRRLSHADQDGLARNSNGSRVSARADNRHDQSPAAHPLSRSSPCCSRSC